MSYESTEQKIDRETIHKVSIPDRENYLDWFTKEWDKATMEKNPLLKRVREKEYERKLNSKDQTEYSALKRLRESQEGNHETNTK